MKKKVLDDLITAHYENDDRLFFAATIEVLKELKANGDDAIVKHLDFILKSKVKIAPKREERAYEPEISFEDAEILGWTLTPQTNKEDIEFGIKQEELRKELGFSLSDKLNKCSGE